MGKKASVPFLLNARQATRASRARDVWNGLPNGPNRVLQALGISLLEQGCPPNLDPALSPIGIVAAPECATFLREANNALCVTGRIAPC